MAQHDRNFKNLILDYLRESLEFFARDEVGRLPKNVQFTPLSQERLKEWMGERGMNQDVVVQVDFPSGGREMLVFCIEHNSRELKTILKRQAGYCIRASLEFKTDRIVPVAIFPEETKDVQESFKLAGDHGVYMDFRCITVKLKELEARRFLKSENVVERLCLPFMKFKDKTKAKFETYRSAYQGLKDLEPDSEKRWKYFGFLHQYVELERDEREAFSSEVVRRSSFKGEYMSTWDYAIKEGMEKGLERGMEKGMENTANFVVDLFARGKLDADEARKELKRLAKIGNITQQIAESALAKIKSK